MVYLQFSSQVPSDKLRKLFIDEAKANLRKIEKSMCQEGAYDGYSFNEICGIHNIQFHAFLVNLKVIQNFTSATRST